MKVVLITGATSGIGRASAIEFAKLGYKLVLASRNKKAGDELLRELGGSDAIFQRTDVGIQKDVESLVELAVEKFGRLDVAINNAAVEARGKIDAFDELTYQTVFDTNVKGMFFAMKSEIAAMRRSGGGSIVNISSTAGSRGSPGMSIYGASKHAVEGLSKSAALELAGENIRVNVVAPGPTLTPMLVRVTDGQPEKFGQRVPMSRLGTPEELAHAIVWLASDQASFITGVVLPVNGGGSAC